MHNPTVQLTPQISKPRMSFLVDTLYCAVIPNRLSILPLGQALFPSNVAQETTTADTAAAAPATHSVPLHPVTHSGSAAVDSSLAVDGPAVDSPAVDSPAADNLAANNLAVDNPAGALHNPVAHTSLAADTLAQESLDTTAGLGLWPSSPFPQRVGRFEPARSHASFCGYG
jgi:hypothetical protein